MLRRVKGGCAHALARSESQRERAPPSEALSVAASAAPHAVAGGKEGWSGSLVRPQLQVIEGRVPLMTGCSREPFVTAPPARRFPTVRRQAGVLFFPEAPWGKFNSLTYAP